MTNNILGVRGVAHDLNNQIMILLNCLDRVTVLFPEAEDLSLALSAAERCAELTSQLLPRQCDRRLSPMISLRQVAAETTLLVRALLPAHNRIEFACHTDCRIAAEAADIQQMLVNLCLNAVDAMDGPGCVNMTVEQVGDAVLLSVSDTGPGVPEYLRGQIFEPMYTTKADRGGNGLGLTRVQELADELGGVVTVHEVFPHGACFRIQLPLTRT